MLFLLHAVDPIAVTAATALSHGCNRLGFNYLCRGRDPACVGPQHMQEDLLPMLRRVYRNRRDSASREW
jgi:hypothetical protein